jgi:nucleotide-binding universal stress UspA family protein
MKTIIAAIDFSDASKKVLAQASAMAKSTGAKVYVVHGIEQLAAFYDIYGYTVPDMTNFSQQATDRANEALQKRADGMNLPSDQVETRIVEGTFIDALLDFAREVNGDMLIVGSHGHGLVARVLLGSTAQRLLHKTEIPTLVVPV